MSLIFGIIVLTMENGSTGSSATFGADFYNYVNNNAARTASNVKNLSGIVKLGFGFSLIIAGLITILASAMKLADKPAPAVVPVTVTGNSENTIAEDQLPEL